MPTKFSACSRLRSHGAVVQEMEARLYVSLLKSYARLQNLDRGRSIHRVVAANGLLKENHFVTSMLVDMYVKCGSLVEAQEVFDELDVHDVVTWTALIAGYAQHFNGDVVLHLYEQMQQEGISPNAFTFSCIIKACGILGEEDRGREVHAITAVEGSLESSGFVASALVDMYAKCGIMDKAQETFDSLMEPDVFAWTALISGYLEHDQANKALKCFELLQPKGVAPSPVTYACILKACGSIGDPHKGREVHGQIIFKGVLERELVLGNALIDMYTKCGLLSEARGVLDSVHVRDVVSWTTIIVGYAEFGFGEEACDCFKQMLLEGISPDAFTFSCCLRVCGNTGAAVKGSALHTDIEKLGFLRKDPVVGNALVDMYSKCGLLKEAQDVFDHLVVRDRILWNTLITGYSQHGEFTHACYLVDQMNHGGFEPHPITFVNLLNACTHTGLVDEGHLSFEVMRKQYDITPIVEHHTCMVDLLGRAGQLDRAVALIKVAPFHPNTVTWLAILGACRKWNCLELGAQAFEAAIVLDMEEPSVYVCMYNLYADASFE